MKPFTYLAIHDVSCIAAAAYLATHDCPVWAFVFVVMALVTNVKEGK